MAKEPTRAELAKEVARLSQELYSANDTLKNVDKLDEAQRKELTIALKKNPEYIVSGGSMRDTFFDPGAARNSDRTEPIALSWSQIFMEIGRLREIKSRQHLTDTLEEQTQHGKHLLERLDRATGIAEKIAHEGEDRIHRGY